jgi:SAM-dependent methyltransferase
MTFQDHFSGHAAEYARFRPRSPEPLFDWLAQVVPGRRRAWDAGTGNGQAAIPLAERFSEVIATDPSAEQLLRVPPNPRIRTLVAAEECAAIESASVDLVTVAQAAHWFDLERFSAEVDRVCRAGAVVALWSYGLFRVDQQIDEVVRRFYRDVVGPYWPPERRLVDEEYRTLPFYWPEIEAPRFAIENSLTLEGVLAYVHTWSAVQRFIGERGFDPVPLLGDELRDLWSGPRLVRFELALRVGRVGLAGLEREATA